MKIFSAQQIKDWDKATITEQAISFYQLMERAADACLQWIKQRFSIDQHFDIFCGNGNNGGDGLALTRLLLENGYSASALLLNVHGIFSDPALHHLEKLQQLYPTAIEVMEEPFDFMQISPNTILIDALLGTGLSRELTGRLADLVTQINTLPNKLIAIDLPTGIFTDRLAQASSIAIRADFTLSLQGLKRSFFHPEVASALGSIDLLDIGLSTNFSDSTNTQNNTLDRELIRSIYKRRDPFSHKGTYGTAVLIGGSYGKMGSIGLSAKSALRAGAGKVFIQAPDCGYHILQSLVPEAMFENVGGQYVEKIRIFPNTVIGIGPGLGTQSMTYNALKDFLDVVNKESIPIVIDADAINIIADHKESLLPLIPLNSIFTPHPKEFEHLFGSCGDSMKRTELAIAKSIEHQIYIILKGHYTTICTPQGACWYNINGNAGMATAGSGDVLTGIITGLLAQHYPPFEAALFGVYLHGQAGDLAADELSQESLIAGDIIEYLGHAFLQLK